MNLQEYETKKEESLKGNTIIKLEGDELYDQIRGTAKKIKNGAVQIRDEMKLQEPLISDLERNIDKVENKMKRTENKLATYLNKSSSSCLYWTIFIEFILLILFFAM